MPDCKDNCAMESRIIALEDANKQHSKTHGEMYNRLRDLEKSDAAQDAHYKAIDDKLRELTVMVKELSGKPGRRWDGLVDKLLYAAALAWVAARASGLGT